VQLPSGQTGLALLCNGFAAPNVPNAKNPEWKFFSLLLDFFIEVCILKLAVLIEQPILFIC